MSCRETQELLHGYVDGQLDLVRSLEMERHFRECPACSRDYENLRGMRSAMSGSLPYFQPPAGLERRLHARLRAETGARAHRCAVEVGSGCRHAGADSGGNLAHHVR